MSIISRREFGGAVLALGAGARKLWSASGLDETLRDSMQRRKIPAVAAMVATADKTTYSGAFGKRDSASGVNLQPDSIFAIASMTKAITSTAALQLVERGKLTLDEPAAKHLPELGKPNVLQGFDSAGKPILRPATKPVTLRNLMTHTSGFAYDTWDADILRYTSQAGGAIAPGTVAPLVPLAFEPGTRWQYGYGLDWTGRLVETVSGQTLEQYFQTNIMQPLGMKDTGFILPPDKFDRLVSVYTRQSDGSLKENPRTMPAPPKAFNGGGGLYSTASDYVRFMQMILHDGRGNGKEQILQAKTVQMMKSNQVGAIRAGVLKTARPALSSDVDFHPGATDKYTFGFLMNPTAYEGGRSAGSLAWAGIYNTYYWIDPKRALCAVVMMQFLPFADKEGVGLLGDFERAVYRAT
ncbi:MAG TPA: serine hydrolase domain-containing protein [Bryobacteraceae bacterium]|jgi:CubicO group peptidase (beta-lactamase class C family)